MQLDSLSDLISFGVAPAILMYKLALEPQGLGKAGIAIAVLYVLCCALRLARFNVLAQTGQVHKHFVGLPTPAAAGVILSFVLSYELLGDTGVSLNTRTIPALMQSMPAFFKAMPIVMVVLSFLMVSNIPYLSFKRMQLTRVRTIQLLALLIVLVILVLVYPQNIFFIVFSVYAASGLLIYVPRIIWNKRHSRSERIASE
jgi:CDP-diacylglycerol--serine O-phosphatidyltransferase